MHDPISATWEICDTTLLGGVVRKEAAPEPGPTKTEALLTEFATSWRRNAGHLVGAELCKICAGHGRCKVSDFPLA